MLFETFFSTQSEQTLSLDLYQRKFIIIGIRAGKLSSPDFLDKRGLDTSCVQASS